MPKSILVVGSLAYDSIKTPTGEAKAALGGSANYFGLAASFFAPVKVVGVVGDDYKAEDRKILEDKNVDISGIETVSGKTFHWAGEYSGDMNEAKTLRTDLNVFADFHPKLSANHKHSEYVFLANIDPVLQMEVLNQIIKPKLIAADTMNFWISTKEAELKKIMNRLDLLIINEGEAKLLTGTQNTILSCELIAEMGPKAVVVKRGEYGFILYYKNEYFAMPAFPLKNVVDPTGAGDTFAGGFMGYLAKYGLGLEWESLKQAAIFGSLMASFTVQDFSVGALKNLTQDQLYARYFDFKKVISFNQSDLGPTKQ